jgi:Heterokaryon incompatibility protein (HET)
MAQSMRTSVRGERDYKVNGTSTAAMPQLWNHWLRNCSESHLLCKIPTAKDSFTPNRLIEIVSKNKKAIDISWRLVVFNSTDSVKYVTLSHYWGSSIHVELTKATYSILCKGSQASLLPKTYQEALEVASILGFRYIWIDSLCIFQDDVDDWRKQSLMMGAIYSNTSCNIAATFAEDSEQGCYSTRDPSILSSTTIASGRGFNKATTYRDYVSGIYHKHTINSPLNRRGWVIQERCLAPRQLNFDEHQVFWEYAHLSAYEQFPDGLPENLWQGDLVEPPAAKLRLNFTNERDLRQM